jgi:hypothetical protein
MIVDEYTAGGFDGPRRLQDWLKDEIDYMDMAHLDLDLNDPFIREFSTPREAIFRYGGPIAMAIVTMVSLRTDDWIGTPENLLAELSAFRVRGGPQLPPNPFVVASTAIAQEMCWRTLASSSSESMTGASVWAVAQAQSTASLLALPSRTTARAKALRTLQNNWKRRGCAVDQLCLVMTRK